MHSIITTNTLLFLFKASRIKKITFVYLHLTIGLQRPIIVVGYFPGVIVDGDFRITAF
jgi:hypothetical protein